MVEPRAITIIGASNAGLILGQKLAREGFETQIIEEHSVIGEPVNCAGLVSIDGARKAGLDLEQSALGKVKRALLYSPKGNVLEAKKKKATAYVIDRSKHDKLLYEQAVKSGAEVMLGKRLMDKRGDLLFLRDVKGSGQATKTKLLIGADGPLSKVRELMGVTVPKEFFVQASFGTVIGDFETECVEVYLSQQYKGFFAWLIPESKEKARVGAGCSTGNSAKALEYFCNAHYPEQKGQKLAIEGQTTALIPAGPPLKQVQKENLFIVGDAAFQTKATTGGGIVYGALSAQNLAKAIIRNFKEGEKIEYSKENNPVYNELYLHWKIRRYANSLADKKIDKLFASLKKAGAEQFLEENGNMDFPSEFMYKFLSKPKLWKFAPRSLRILASR